MFQDNPRAAWIYDPLTLGIREANAAARAQYEFSEEEFLTRTIRSLDCPSGEAETSEQGAQQCRHRRRDGTVLWVELASRTIDLPEGVARLVMANDIADRKHAEERYQALFDCEIHAAGRRDAPAFL